jgi:hypothetical protein
MTEQLLTEARRELSARSRNIAIVAWCSFMAASLATMFAFAVIDPLAVRECEIPDWWSTRLHVYGLGFFFFWFVAAVAGGFTVFMTRTEHRPTA